MHTLPLSIRSTWRCSDSWRYSGCRSRRGRCRPGSSSRGTSRRYARCRTTADTTRYTRTTRYTHELAGVWRSYWLLKWVKILFMPRPFEEWWRGIKCYPCPSVHLLSKFGVRSITFERLHRFNSNLVC